MLNFPSVITDNTMELVDGKVQVGHYCNLSFKNMVISCFGNIKDSEFADFIGGIANVVATFLALGCPKMSARPPLIFSIRRIRPVKFW